MCVREVLGEVVAVVFCTRFPVDVEVSLEDVIANPVVPHVNSFVSFLFYQIVRDADGIFVIGLKLCRWLHVAKVREDGAYRFYFL